MIGDPSGKSSERQALPENIVNKNSSSISENIQRIFSNHEQYLCEKNRDKKFLSPVKYWLAKLITKMDGL